MFDLVDLVHATLVAAASELGVQEHVENLVGEARRDDAPAHRQHVRVVVLSRHPRGVEVVAQRCTNTVHLVRGDLFSLTASAEHDAEVGRAASDPLAHLGTNRWIIDALLVVGAKVVDVVTTLSQTRDEVDLQSVSRVIGTDRHPHEHGSYGRDAHMLRRVRRRFTSWALLAVACCAGVVGFATVPADAATVDVSIDDFEFSPTTVSATPGDTVRFTNNGSAIHHVVAADGSFDSGVLESDESFSVIIGDRPVPFSCARHENMTGTIALQIAGTTTSASTVTAAATTVATIAPSATTASELAFTGSERGPLALGAMVAMAIGAIGLAFLARRHTPVGAIVGADLLPGSDRDRRRARVSKPPAEL